MAAGPAQKTVQYMVTYDAEQALMHTFSAKLDN